MELSSIDPKLWGYFFWNTIDFVIAAYPEKASEPLIQTTKTFFENWKVMLPCKDSRKHYAEFYDSNPIDFSSRNSLNLWISKLRNSKTSKTETSKTPKVSKVVPKTPVSINAKTPSPIIPKVLEKTQTPRRNFILNKQPVHD